MQHAEAVFDSPLGRIESGWGASPYKRERCVGAKRRRKHYILD